jgi:hypothetical protein
MNAWLLFGAAWLVLAVSLAWLLRGTSSNIALLDESPEEEKSVQT